MRKSIILYIPVKNPLNLLRPSRLSVCLRSPYVPGILLYQPSGNHNLMAAAHTFQTEIRSYP